MRDVTSLLSFEIDMQNQLSFCFKLFLLTLVPASFACQPAILKENRIYEETLEPVNFFYPEFRDDMDWGLIDIRPHEQPRIFEKAGP